VRILLTLFLAAMMAPAQDVPDAIIGVKIYYSNRVVKIAAAEMPQGWIKAPADDVQVVNVYHARTYDADGKPRHFKDTIEGKDYYFFSKTSGFGNADVIREIPEDAVGIKIGRLLPDGEWLKLYNRAHQDHDFN